MYDFQFSDHFLFNFHSIAAPKFVIRPTAQSVDIQSDASFECQVSVKTMHISSLLEVQIY